MRVLIIGGTGSIASYVAERLSQQGHEITIATRGVAPSPTGYKQIIANRDDPVQFAQALRAWEGDVSYDFICMRREHAQNIVNILRGRTKQHVFISTAAVYDKSSLSCIPLTESSPVNNFSSWEYSRRKQECESFFLEQYQQEGFPITIIRPSHTLGLGRVPSPLAGGGYVTIARIEQGRMIVLPNDGQSLWTLTASWDFAMGAAGLAGNAKAIGEIFHITHDQVLTWNVITREIGLAAGREPVLRYLPVEEIIRLEPSFIGSLREDQSRPTVFDNAKIKRFVPDFECRTSFRDYMRQCMAWYREDRSRQQSNEKADAMFDRLLTYAHEM